VIRALRKQPAYLPSVVAGTSAGSIAAVLLAAGLDQERLEDLARRFDWFHDVIRLTDTIRSVVSRGQRGGLVSNAGLGQTMNQLLDGRSFDDLAVDTAVVATDLENRRRVIFTGPRAASRMSARDLERHIMPPAVGLPGCETLVVSDMPDVGLAVRASCAVPGLFLPVVVGDMRLVDGGVLDQVPVDVVRALGATFAIGVSLAMGPYPVRITNAAAALAASVGLMGSLLVRRSLELADIGFQVSGIEERSLVDTHQLDLIELGEREMAARIAAHPRPRRKSPGPTPQRGKGKR
jgi:NTE family protein